MMVAGRASPVRPSTKTLDPTVEPSGGVTNSVLSPLCLRVEEDNQHIFATKQPVLLGVCYLRCKHHAGRLETLHHTRLQVANDDDEAILNQHQTHVSTMVEAKQQEISKQLRFCRYLHLLQCVRVTEARGN